MNLSYPGYRSLISSTRDWRTPAEGPITWVAYGLPDDQKTAERRQGFASTRDEAIAAVEAALRELRP